MYTSYKSLPPFWETAVTAVHKRDVEWEKRTMITRMGYSTPYLKEGWDLPQNKE